MPDQAKPDHDYAAMGSAYGEAIRRRAALERLKRGVDLLDAGEVLYQLGHHELSRQVGDLVNLGALVVDLGSHAWRLPDAHPAPALEADPVREPTARAPR